MTANEQQIRKAHSKAKSKSFKKKMQWQDIRKDHKIDRHNAILDLVCAGVALQDAREITDKLIKEDRDNFRFDAINEITRKKRALESKLKVKTHKHSL
jgi:hypothetical protein